MIDEVQKIPALLDEVHSLIEESGRKLRFLLTGSSSLRLRQEGSNMLAGRARTLHLFPLTWRELGPKFDLSRRLSVGALPSIYTSRDDPWLELGDYVDTYLKDEIRDECKLRNLDGFERFLISAAARSGEMLNYAKVANDAQTSPSSVRNYYDILEETLVVIRIPPWQSPLRKAVQTEKIYFFDVGVRWRILGQKVVSPKSEKWGEALEHLIANELIAYAHYQKKDEKICFWRDMHQHEVDFIIGNAIAIEVNGSLRVEKSDLSNLRLLATEQKWRDQYLVSCDLTNRQTDDGIHIVNWSRFLSLLWDGKIF